ncbi:amino acid-binding protein [Candidatus Bathyarchaeota archaeon]|nr:amino acid-binding protein [Candidatus Bathyarchaeota archaeon]
MWNKTKRFFGDSPSKLKVAKLIVETGLRIGDKGKIYCGEIEIPATKLAVAAGVDRRVIKETAEAILKADDLRGIFMNLRPAGPLLRDVAQYLGYGVLEIKAKSEAPGIIAEATVLIAKEGISIRQILAEDADIYPDPKLILITDRPIPGELLPKLLKIPTVEQVTIA